MHTVLDSKHYKLELLTKQVTLITCIGVEIWKIPTFEDVHDQIHEI